MPVSPSSCSADALAAGLCTTADSDGTQVDVTGTREPSGPGGGNDSPDGDGPPPGDDETAEPEDCGPADVLCRDGYTVEVIGEVTASDLVSFVPAKPSFTSEPGGVGIVGMPTNFVAGASEQTMTGTLFELPVTVRFTPAAYVFAYGDGASARSTSGGTAWTTLGQPQFSATPTSHAYASRGRYVSSVSVEYAAAVNFGAGWRPVNGIVTATAGGQTVDVYEARTALVDKTCAENPSGPGC
ncbi:hypothetical protein ACFXP7_11670 [Microbacterium sp. P06]|uniref:hypothetical protein n=1 Tax=Microbacterium sp. P06 TaxID=3366949 RepID=UPI00374720F6